jgi:putative endopeptidase
MRFVAPALLALFALACCPAAPVVPRTPVAPVEPTPSGPRPVPVTLADVGLDATALDRNVNPCEDFYQFACGGWLHKTPVPGDEASWYRSFDEIQRRNEVDLRAILEDAAKNPGDDAVVKQLGTFYGACMDEAAAEKQGLAPIAPLLAKVKGLKNLRDLPGVLAELNRHGVWPLFRASAEQDLDDATRVMLQIDEGGLGLPDRDDYLSQDERATGLRKAYLAHVEAMLRLGGLDAKAAAKGAADVLRLETELATVTKTRVERRDPKGMHHATELEALRQAAPALDWQAWLAALETAGVTRMNVTSPGFVAGLGVQLGKTPLPVLRTYLTWHVLRSTAGVLTQALFDESFRMAKVLTGQDEPKPRWRRCIDATDGALGEALAQPFVQRRFSGESKPAAVEMVEAIRAAFGQAVAGLVWMDEATRVKAGVKLQAMEFLIGYPDTPRHYDFAIEAGRNGQNALAARQFETRRQFAKIGKPVDRREWQMSPPTVNAYYDPQKNHMVFPAGILQPPFYDVRAGVAVNLGGIGMVVAHELTHGFDDEGAQFDAKGDLRDWWTPTVAEQFRTKTKCIAEQYSAYRPLPDLPLNGQLTLGENIADAGGVKLAFAAYRRLRAQAKETPVADGFTEDQQFFLAQAQTWCGNVREAQVRLAAQTDPHSPPRFRVNGPLSQLPAFAEAFHCPQGTPMSPAQRCDVW